MEKVTEASQQTLDQSEETIKNLLRSERQQKTLDKWIKEFREEYKDDTNCADDYRVAECKNAPKEKTDTGPASGGNPNPQAPHPQRRSPLLRTRSLGMPDELGRLRCGGSTRSPAAFGGSVPWDREQDERSIVPHTVEEAYELADAANSGDDAKLLDELGDVLFQVYFLALLMEERGAGRRSRRWPTTAARS